MTSLNRLGSASLLAIATLVVSAENAAAQGPIYWPGPIHSHHRVWPHVRPSRPVIVSPGVVTSVNPMTGGLNTSSSQINNTAFDPLRHHSLHNGSRRWVRRPVYDHWGRVVGYKEGWVWNNSLTGQEHGHVQVHTPNGLGGVNSASVAYSVRGR